MLCASLHGIVCFRGGERKVERDWKAVEDGVGKLLEMLQGAEPATLGLHDSNKSTCDGRRPCPMTWSSSVVSRKQL